jgi:GNAT superfamily N-acetyltransferase
VSIERLYGARWRGLARRTPLRLLRVYSRPLDPPPRAVYLFKTFILPSHRGRGVATALYRAADSLAARPGREVLVSWVELHNPPAVRRLRLRFQLGS